ncbi:hypothetical protein GCM10009601_26270 [Streptomyces thermospinosisporus]|uniref:Uncharacterized protein n=1 Tax=Streptomyces thermospinosisporus TaxID=161482 RepID=A0ABP4JJL4_9ACTN
MRVGTAFEAEGLLRLLHSPRRLVRDSATHDRAVPRAYATVFAELLRGMRDRSARRVNFDDTQVT